MSDDSVVHLRGHHLLCILTYKGAGYSAAFTENFDRLIEKLNAGAVIKITDGPDDVCCALKDDPSAPHWATNCISASVQRRDQKALAAVGRHFQQKLETGSRLKLSKTMIDDLRQAFASGLIRAACQDCEWQGFCDDIAAGNFAETKLE